MNYMITMTLSGSCLYLLYKLFRLGFGESLEERWYYLLLKITALYFVIPLPWLKEVYRKAAEFLTGTRKAALGVQYSGEEWLVLQYGEEWVFNHSASRQMAFLGLWGVGVILVSISVLVYYLRRRRRLLQDYSDGLVTAEKLLSKEMLEEYPFHRRVEFRICNQNLSPFTIGILKPVIFCGRQDMAEERELLLRHELVHIRRMDLLWQLAGILVFVMHWYNPIVWLFRRELEAVCESSCDEQVLQGAGIGVRTQYAMLLLRHSDKQEEELLTINLSKGGKAMKNRLCRILNQKKHFPKVIGMTFAGALILLNSLTVMAYEDWHFQRYETEIDEKWLAADLAFIPEGEDLQLEMSEFFGEYIQPYEVQSLYEQPVLPFADNTCLHDFEPGRYREHIAKEDGSCETYYYHALQCTKCQCIRISKTWMVLKLQCTKGRKSFRE